MKIEIEELVNKYSKMVFQIAYQNCFIKSNAEDVTQEVIIKLWKNAEKLNTLGEQMAEKYGVSFLPSDFKKKEGYKRSIELSGELDLYRQDYCGCGFSKAESILRKQQKEQENSLTEEKRIGSQM